MAERQLKPADVVYPCVHCLRPFSDRSNRRRHVTRAHPGVSTENLAAIRSSSSAASSNTLSLRHMVAAVTEDVLKTNFTRPSDELVSTIRTLAPSLSLREAEVLLAATSAAVKHFRSVPNTEQSSTGRRTYNRRGKGPYSTAGVPVSRASLASTLSERRCIFGGLLAGSCCSGPVGRELACVVERGIRGCRRGYTAGVVWSC